MSFLTKENTQDIYPLSPTQKGMLFHSVLDDTAPVYFEQLSFTINGMLDIDAFKTAWDHIISLNTTFRTLFKWTKVKDPLQIVLKKLPVELLLHDISGLEKTEQNIKIQAFLHNDKATPFNLEQGPLIRLNLFVIDDQTHHFVWSHHHIIIDGWCLPIVLKDLFDAYMSYVAGSTLPSPVRRPYRDYIGWYLKQDKDKALTFWKKQLGDLDAPTSLPVDRIPGPSSSTKVAKEELVLSQEMTLALQDLAQKERITQSSLIQAVWAILLSNYSSLNDVVFGATVSGRPADLKGSEDMVGLFINTLPVRVSLTYEITATQLLHHVQDISLAIRDYEYSLLPDIKAVSAIPNTQNLFDSIVVFENYPIESFSMVQDSGFSISDTKAFEMTNFPLTMLIAPGLQMGITMHYYKSLFDKETVQSMMEHMSRIISAVTENPDIKVSEIDILTPVEKEKILDSFNDTQKDYPLDKCVYQIIQEQASRTPEQTAVTFEDRSLTYKALNDKTNQLARYLRKLGVGKETMVALILDRSLEMEIALLGVMKSGGAYVPMGTDYPEKRISYILEDTRAPVVLVHERFAHRITKEDVKVICLDTKWDDIAKEEISNLNPESGPEDLAYVLYTSGSTGEPKGVACIHKGLCNRLVWMQEAYQLKNDDCVLQKTPYTFDVSGWEFFWPFMYGARLHFLKPEGHKDPLHIMEVIAEQNITTLHFVPSMLGGFLQIVNDQNKESLKPLRRVICSGEALMVEHRDLFFKHIDGELHNLYGPTEASIDVTYYECKPQDSASTVPIGRPIANTQIYILNKQMMPVPVGVVGEVYIGGVNLARGYVNKPEKTAQAFIHSSISPDRRLYKTGDLGKWLPDGNIEYLGRIDHQVKIRGNRIELGEIESALSRYEGIHDCVVVDRQDQTGDKYLVGYYAAGDAVPVDNLRSFLNNALPEYMVPSRFMWLEKIPLNPNGKADRKALPDIEGVRPEMAKEYVAPRDELETALADVWREVLGVDKVGIHDNFFDLGGHSLLIMKVLSQLQLTYPIKIQDFYDHQTVSELAKRVTKNIEAADEDIDDSDFKEETPFDIPVDITLSGGKEHPENIFLTGATGYLGAHLTYEILNNTDAHLFCLIRGENEDQVKDRLASTLAFYFEGKDIDFSRITPIMGNIETDGLDLNKERSEQLLSQVDTIIHTAADVRHFGEYAHFKNINVLGAKRVIDLAMAGNCKRYHHISTLSIAGDFIPKMSQAFFKESDYNREQELSNVYARSKFESEGLVREAMKNGLNATIYRVGNLVGSSTTGKFQKNIDTSAFYGLIQGMVHMGAVSPGIGGEFDMSPIDLSRKAIVALMMLPETSGQCLHVYNPNTTTFTDLAVVLKTMGYAIKEIPAYEYLSTLKSVQENAEAREVVEKLVPLFDGSTAPKTKMIFDSSVANHFLKAVGFSWPVLSEELITKLMNYCISTEFIMPPLLK